jgi:hypothetical protein
MDELYTMERPRQMPVLQKFRSRKRAAFCWRPDASLSFNLDVRHYSQVAPFMLQLWSATCVQLTERA